MTTASVPSQSDGDLVALHSIVDRLGPPDSWLYEFYTDLHQHPELGHQEVRTSTRVIEALKRFDCDVITGIGGTGVVGIFRNSSSPDNDVSHNSNNHQTHGLEKNATSNAAGRSSGQSQRTVLMRADMDALPIHEETEASFASQTDNVSHACGHDLHTTSLLGVCAALDAHRDQWSGTFIALFQPAEEPLTGAQAMVDDGLLDRIPQPDVCFSQHVVPGPAGLVMSKAGPIFAASDNIRIRIHGRSAHGARPHTSIDPTYIAAHVIVRLQGIVGREVAPGEFAVVTVGQLSAGHSPNTIPPYAELVLNCRFYDTDVRDSTYAAIERMVRGECAASGCERDPEFTYFGHSNLTTNDAAVADIVGTSFAHVLGENFTPADRWTASEDFSVIPEAFGAPYLYWTVGATPRDQWDTAAAQGQLDSDIPGNHSSNFLPDFVPTTASCHRAALTAILTYLGETSH